MYMCVTCRYGQIHTGATMWMCIEYSLVKKLSCSHCCQSYNIKKSI